jgi:hypothetical protein
MQIEMLISKITRDPALMSRVRLDDATIGEYAEVMTRDESSGPSTSMFPPVKITRSADGENYLTDGWHRLAAAEKAGLETFLAEVTQGEKSDALLASAASNDRHGLRRTNDDKRKCVCMIAKHPAYLGKGAREMADAAGVSNRFVVNLSNEGVITLGVRPVTPKVTPDAPTVTNPFARLGPAADSTGSVKSATSDTSGEDLDDVFPPETPAPIKLKKAGRPKKSLPPKQQDEIDQKASEPKVVGKDGKKYPAKVAKPKKTFLALEEDALCGFRDMYDDWREQLRQLPAGTDTDALEKLLDIMRSECHAVKQSIALCDLSR